MSKGTVYLIHFDHPLGNRANVRGQAQHHIGYTNNLEVRLAHYRTGGGAAIMRTLANRGIGWCVVRTWCGTRSYERQFKNRKNAPRLCPICQQDEQE